MDFITEIKKQVNTAAKKIFRPTQDGDLGEMYADVSHIHSALNYQPKTSIQHMVF
jgi:UDP-glucose 4-epimerase